MKLHLWLGWINLENGRTLAHKKHIAADDEIGGTLTSSGNGENGDAMTEMELNCLRLVSEGFTYKEIARKYAYSEVTIKIILSNVCTKLEANNLPHATKIAIKIGLLKL